MAKEEHYIKPSPLTRMLSATPFRVFLMLFFLLLFSWPYLSSADRTAPGALFLYLFGVWALLVVTLVAVGSTDRRIANNKDND